MWSDFDGKKGTLTARRTLRQRKGGGLTTGEAETGKGRRTSTLPPSTAQLLRERRKGSCSQWIFSNPLRPEDPVNPGRAYSRLKTLLKSAGLPGIRFHDLRHTFATHALTSGVDAKTLSGILGHTIPKLIPRMEQRMLCATFLEAALRFYKGPKNEAAFQKWRMGKGVKHVIIIRRLSWTNPLEAVKGAAVFLRGCRGLAPPVVLLEQDPFVRKGRVLHFSLITFLTRTLLATIRKFLFYTLITWRRPDRGK